jgi:hypothetical protein
MTSAQAKSAQKRRKEVEKAVNETIEDTIRSAGPANTIAWVAVTAGAFVLNLLVLVLVTGG